MLLTVIVFLMPICVVANQQKAIVDSIFANYDKRVRPIRDNNVKTQLTVTIDYFHLIEIIENRESMTFTADVRTIWNDDYLTWDPLEFNDTDYIIIPQYMVWIPDLMVANSKSMTPLIERIKRYVMVAYNGSVAMFAPAMYDTECDIDVQRFPFDTQICYIVFYPWLYINNINLSPGDLLSNDSIQENSEWSVVSVSFDPTFMNDSITLKFTLKRQSMFYICVCIVPSYIIVAVCLIGVFTPTTTQIHRDEKIILGLTTLLSMAVMLNIISDKMPKSIKLPSLGWLIVFQIILCVIALICAALLLIVQKKAVLYRWRVPNWFGHNNPTNVIKPITKPSLNQIETIAGRLINDYDRDGYIDLKESEIHQLKQICQSLDNIERLINAKEFVYQLEEKWSEFFMVIDMILHIAFQLIHLIGALLILML